MNLKDETRRTLIRHFEAAVDTKLKQVDLLPGDTFKFNYEVELIMPPEKELDPRYDITDAILDDQNVVKELFQPSDPEFSKGELVAFLKFDPLLECHAGDRWDSTLNIIFKPGANADTIYIGMTDSGIKTISCVECHGTGKYVGLNVEEPCLACKGYGTLARRALTDQQSMLDQLTKKVVTELEHKINKQCLGTQTSNIFNSIMEVCECGIKANLDATANHVANQLIVRINQFMSIRGNTTFYCSKVLPETPKGLAVPDWHQSGHGKHFHISATMRQSVKGYYFQFQMRIQ